MELALRAADGDSGGDLLKQIDSLDVVQEFSWPYKDAPGLLSERIGISPSHKAYGAVGGETPISFIHEAALRVWKGEVQVAAVVGAEAQYSVTAAEKAGIKLGWSPKDADARLIRGVDYLHPFAVALGVASPATVYPFYENAAIAAWNQTPADAALESSEIWSRNSEIAEQNPYAWSQTKLAAYEIGLPTAANRLIAWPYTKHMVANPLVNQGGAVLITSVGFARQLGISPDRLVYIWCGAAAHEPDDYLKRDSFTKVNSQEAVLNNIQEQLGDAEEINFVELYSCFPIVPKMARRILALPDETNITCAGGLSSFGAPLNNYMTHATAAMVRALRAHPKSIGLVYGQGGYLTKHHALVLASKPSEFNRLMSDYSVQDQVDSNRNPAPPLCTDYAGPSTLETFTVIYGRDGQVLRGVAISRTPTGGRVIAEVCGDDQLTIARLVDPDRSPIGLTGSLKIKCDGLQSWSIRDDN